MIKHICDCGNEHEIDFDWEDDANGKPQENE